MNRRLVGAAFAFLLCLLLPDRAAAQGGVIRGVTTDSAGSPLSGIQVLLVGTTRRMVTRFWLAAPLPLCPGSQSMAECSLARCGRRIWLTH